MEYEIKYKVIKRFINDYNYALLNLDTKGGQFDEIIKKGELVALRMILNKIEELEEK